ncbi:MAG: response regulator, partial [Pseudomonadota bacterium]|nr:response regulator [Pseudomonadota bacterium]
GDDNGLGDDLAVYLRDSGAIVERVLDLTAARNRINTLPSGLWLLIIDAGHDAPPIEELRAACRARSDLDLQFVVVEHGHHQSDIDPRFVVIRRGHRRRGRVETMDLVTLDGDVMHPQSFLRAVAIAAGRVHEEDESPLPGKIEAPITPPSRAMALQQGRLVLVAEDNEINQKVIRQQLALLGYAADIASDGREALKRWESGDYALLLTDLHMPEMDGYQLTAAIRVAEASKVDKRRIPIIALTANALKGEAEHCCTVGMDDYLSKPVQLTDLKSMLEEWLSTADSSPNSTVTPAMPITPAMAAGQVDVSVLEGLVGNDPAVISEFLRDFRSSSARIAVELRTAFQLGQAAAVSAAAHKLKSSARSVGALVLGELCAEMEQAGKVGDTEALAVLLLRFEAEMVVVDRYLGSL